MWNDYWKTTQKAIAVATTRSNHPRPNPYALNNPQQPYAFNQQLPVLQTTTAVADVYDARLAPKQLLQQQQPQPFIQQQPQPQQPQIQQQQQQLGNNNKNDDPLAVLLNNKYYHSGLQELKTINRPPQSLSDNSPYGGKYKH